MGKNNHPPQRVHEWTPFHQFKSRTNLERIECLVACRLKCEHTAVSRGLDVGILVFLIYFSNLIFVSFYRCQMIFSFCFQGGEEQHSILLATTGDRWRQSGLDRPDSTFIFAFFHIRSFAVPREVCMIVDFHWFSTFLPGWGSFQARSFEM